jgi:tetratricopeptide (TPR) repeat protein
MYREREESDRAIQTYQTIVELDSEDAEAWTALGNLLDARGDPVALRCFDNAIKANPEYVQGWHSKAYYLQNHGQIPAAIAIYRHIHSIDSLYADAWLNRGILYLETDSLAESEDCFRWLMALDTLSPLAFYYAGVVAQQMGKTEVARNHLHKALALAPGSPRVQEAIDQLR